MLTHPTVDKLHQLRCAAMAKALAEQLRSPEIEALAFEERLGLIVDRELTERASRQLTNTRIAAPTDVTHWKASRPDKYKLPLLDEFAALLAEHRLYKRMFAVL